MVTPTQTSFGPSLELTPEHELLRQTARDFAQREIAPVAAHFDETGEFPRETIRKMGELGFMGIEVPEAYGGAGLDSLAYVLALEEISKVDAAHGTIMSVNNSLFCHGILRFGTEVQKMRCVKSVAEGRAIGAYSLTEPMSGSDAGTMRSRAVRQGEKYVLNGRKSWVTSGPVADFILVFTMTDPDKKHRGITAFLIDTTRRGFSRGKDEPKLGIRASATCEIVFDGYEAPIDERLGDEGEGFKIAMTVLDAGRIGIAAQSLGIAEAA
jgi:alkylation response protein AidB-like acyl-CoA dehydrogenase